MKMKIMTSHHNLSTFPLKPCFFLALLSLSLFHLFSSRSPISQTLVTQNYIVRFKDYEKSDHHRRYLESRVKSDGWKWIERRNPAMDYATDFGVLAIQKESVIGEIEGLEMVKDVNLDFSYTKRDLLGFVDGEKRPGKMFTSMSFSEAGESYAVAQTSNSSIHWGRQLLGQKSQVTSLFGADVLWSKGFTGHKVKMAIFDTGIRADHPHFRNIKERTNWTNEDTLNDNLGHGTFVAGVIAGQDAECLGFAPDAEIYAFRVFTDAQPIAGILHVMVP
ncbi:MEMBRANE-BOUND TRANSCRIPTION FACTOR SITE-1 PROTEASE [Salix viminalis]|uniref:MEMBRANE-BOUND TRANSCRIPTION FACTOR SITE-1 PROTEASE n=1 Tax=Salix viminalis TaxID=40686 RepID=A0A6N2KNB7_SALVM|nr:MEMBRANE-BOUND TRANSCRIPTION FACTOR SITE-1 PROTEASE [Salix viminalis]